MEQIERFARARLPLIQLVTHEEQRALQYLSEVSNRLGENGQPFDFFLWTLTNGMLEPRKKNAEPMSMEPPDAIKFVVDHPSPGVFVFLDFHPFMTKEHPSVVRALRDFVRNCKDKQKTLVLLQPTRVIPMELEKEMAFVELALPDVLQLHARLTGNVKKLTEKGKVQVNLDAEAVEGLIQAGQGLTRDEFDSALSMSVVEHGRLDDRAVDMVAAVKRDVIKKTGMLEFIERDTKMEGVGGLEPLKHWVLMRKRAFTGEAREFGLPMPKGLLMIGIQGCGKSLVAKAVADAWDLPLLRLDMGALFGGFVGESERNARHALQIAEAVSPCCLWIDEIEKAMAGAGSSGSTDSGTTARVFSTVLTWMNEKKKPVFVVATANRVQDLPPELMRKGRFDEIFFVDLPSYKERVDILRIHVGRRGRAASKFDLRMIAKEAAGFSGAELEQLVVAGMYEAFYAERDLEQKDLVTAVQGTVPLSVTMREQVDYLRDWCKGRAVLASEPSEEPQDESSSEVHVPIGIGIGGGGYLGEES